MKHDDLISILGTIVCLFVLAFVAVEYLWERKK